jgi:hypothetical protein
MQGSIQGACVGGQIGGSDNAERNEKYRLMSIRNTALHLAQQNNTGHSAQIHVEEAQVYFNWLNQ